MLAWFRELEGARFTNLIKDLRFSKKNKCKKPRWRVAKRHSNVRVL